MIAQIVDCQSGPASALTWETDFTQVAAVQFDAVDARSRRLRSDGFTFAPPRPVIPEGAGPVNPVFL
jgi:hypothetical protein